MNIEQLHKQATDHESRLSRLEGIIEQVNERLRGVEEELRNLRDDMMKGQWRLVALILTTWISLGALIIWKVG